MCEVSFGGGYKNILNYVDSNMSPVPCLAYVGIICRQPQMTLTASPVPQGGCLPSLLQSFDAGTKSKARGAESLAGSRQVSCQSQN